MSNLAVFFTLESRNAKTGPIPVSTTSAQSCPDACPLKKKGCYAKYSYLGMMWAKLTRTTPGKKFTYSGNRLQSLTWNLFCETIAKLPNDAIWRHNQAGDLPGANDRIDRRALRQLVKANKGKRGFTYTHYPPTPHNARAIAESNAAGFTINLSADNLIEADSLAALDIGPVVTILPQTIHGHADIKTPAGTRVVVCPATYRDDDNCQSCQLCQRQKRKCIIGFPAHGGGKKTVSTIAQG